MITISDDDAMAMLWDLIHAGRLVATVDVSGEPFHFVTCLSRRTIGDELILWLDPMGVDDDLMTVMSDRSEGREER
jgi:hypothetical protein